MALSPDEKAALAALMAKLIADDNGDAMAEALETDAAEATERARIYAQEEADALAARQAHELAVIDAQADATVRVIEAEAEADATVAAIEANAATDVADKLAGATSSTADALGIGDADGDGGAVDDTLDAAADLLGDLTGSTPDLETPELLAMPDTGPAAADLLEDVAPKAQHWWTKERGRRRR